MSIRMCSAAAATSFSPLQQYWNSEGECHYQVRHPWLRKQETCPLKYTGLVNSQSEIRKGHLPNDGLQLCYVSFLTEL